MLSPNTQNSTLLLGASGLLGWNLCQTAPENMKVVAQHHHSVVDLELTQASFELLNLNLAQESAFETLKQHQNTAIIYAAAYSDISTCKKYPQESYIVNVELPIKLSQWCAEHNTPFLYYSTDLVFDGQRAPYNESSPTNPLSLYGEQKAKAEENILSTYKDALIFRCPLLYGEASSNRPATLQNMISQFKCEQSMKLFIDEFRTPARAKRIADFTWDSLGKRHGLYNVGGPESLSRHEMGMAIADTFKLNHKLIQSIRQSDLPQLGLRPSNCSLNSQKAIDAGYHALSFSEEIKLISKMSSC